MFYIKNVPGWERLLRILIGVACLGFTIMNLGTSGVVVFAGIVGAMLSMTGLFGFCPMCAMLGRKLTKK